MFARNPQSEVSDVLSVSPATLMEWMFRHSWFMATEKRGEMLRAGREDELDPLVTKARPFQESLRRETPD